MSNENNCAFCGKSDKEVYLMICGKYSNICNECVTLSVRMIRDKLGKDKLEIEKAVSNE